MVGPVAVRVRGRRRRRAMACLTTLILPAVLGCVAEEEPPAETGPAPSSGDEIAAQLCDLDSWSERLQGLGVAVTEADSDPRAESFSCTIGFEADLTEEFDTEVQLELDLFGRQTEFGSDYRDAIESESGLCEALTELGEGFRRDPTRKPT
ncbi:hypothetical protein GCM10029992_19610 [Glycomyces albus]